MRTRVSNPHLLPLLGLVLVGCSAAAHTVCPVPAAPGSRTVTRDELMATQQQGLYEALALVRLQRSPTRGQDAVVYLDGVPLWDLQALRSVRVETVVDVVFMSAAEATTRYGTGNTGGAIVVRTIGSGPVRHCGG